MSEQCFDREADAVAFADSMAAIVQTEYGSTPEKVLRPSRIKRPSISAHEVLVHVRAAGLDRGTWHLMTGEPFLIRLMGFGLARPKSPVPGLDLAGTVTAVGSEVTRFRPGDEVYGFGNGSAAEYAAAQEDRLALKPTNLSFEHAAVVPLCGVTALQALRDAGRTEPGHHVLVVGASGGVGTFAVQIAKAFGARVTGVCSTSKVDLVWSLGADAVIDYTTRNFADGRMRYDLIVDIGGSSPLMLLRSALASSGTVVIVGGEQGGKITNGFGRQLRAPLLSAIGGRRLTMLVNKKRTSDLDELRALIESGQVSPVLDSTYSLSDTSQAMQRLIAGRVRGKIGITVWGDSEQPRPSVTETASTPSQAQPLIVVLHDHPDDLAELLTHRFGADYRIGVARSGADVAELIRDNVPPGLALVLADRLVAGDPTTQLLAKLRTTDPAVLRCILVPAGDRVVARGVHTAIAAGSADRTLPSPWGHPDVELYPAVSTMLGQWWRKVAPDQVSAVQLTIAANPAHPRLAELRDLADRNNVTTRLVGPGDAEGQRLFADAGAGPDSVVLAAPGGAPMVDPTVSQIGALVGARTVPPSDHCDLLIIGAGPAGLAAAVYAASEGLATVMLERRAIGGQAGTSSSIKNYPGFPYGVSGADLATLMVQQAWMLGAESVYREAVALHTGKQNHRVVLEGGEEMTARSVVLATGVQHRRLRAPGVERLLSAGVYHGAARAEARTYTGKDVFVVGGGNSAGQAAIHLAQYARSVTLLIRGESLAATTSSYLLREIERTHNVAIRGRSEIVEAHGDHRLEALSIRIGGDTSREHADAVFIMIGADPDTGWLPPEIGRDHYGYILTGTDTSSSITHQALAFESTVPGIFAIGDVRHGSVKRVATAVGEGAVCSVSVHLHLARSETTMAGASAPVTSRPQ